MLSAPPTVLICDDDPGFRLLVEMWLEEAGLAAGSAGPGEAAAVAALHQPRVVLFDLRLGRDTEAVLADLRAAAPGAVVIAYTGLPAFAAVAEAERLGLARCVEKDSGHEGVVAAVRDALRDSTVVVAAAA